MPAANPRLTTQVPHEYPNPRNNHFQPCLGKCKSMGSLGKWNVDADSSEHPMEALFGFLIMVGLLGFYGISTITTSTTLAEPPVLDSQVTVANQP